MEESWEFLQDWTLFLAFEATAVVLFFAVYTAFSKRTAGKTVVFIRVEVFLKPNAFDTRLSGTAVLQANFFHAATNLESTIRRLGGEVVARPGVGRPLTARLPRRSLPQLVRNDLVDRVETSPVVAFEIGRGR